MCRGILSKKLGALPVILAKIVRAGYQVSYRLYDAADFGAPQHRRRVIFFLSRDGETIEPMIPTHGGEGQPRHATLRDALGHLQGTAMDVRPPTPAVLRYIQHVPAGGDWRSIPPEFQTPWVLKITQTSKDLFHRSAQDQPARTLTCVVGSNKRTPHRHPDELRCLSVQECAATQTFPPEFCFAGSRNQRYKQIGNAVPVMFAQAVAEHLLAHMARHQDVEVKRRAV
jgi:DNA (cytosine-5)-methyltransferase 1